MKQMSWAERGIRVLLLLAGLTAQRHAQHCTNTHIASGSHKKNQNDEQANQQMNPPMGHDRL